MLRPEFVQLAAIVLAAISTGAIVYVLVMPFIGDERKASKRVADAVEARGRMRGKLSQTAQMRRKQVEDTIKDLEAKEKAKRRLTLRNRIARANLSITTTTYWILSALAGLIGAGGVFIAGSPLFVAVLAGVACGLGLPRWYLSRRAKRYQANFLTGFANAVDVIVRGIRTGLPLLETLKTIAEESPEPVRTEFRHLVEQQNVGVPLARTFERMHERLPLPEVNFFAIVIAIQAQTGGNLSEALANLSQVLRDRYSLQAKVRTFSGEAKASALIIGSLPPLIMLIVFVIAPSYIELLWTNEIGKVMLIMCAVWMLIGIAVMRKMIRFDY